MGSPLAKINTRPKSGGGKRPRTAGSRYDELSSMSSTRSDSSAGPVTCEGFRQTYVEEAYDKTGIVEAPPFSTMFERAPDADEKADSASVEADGVTRSKTLVVTLEFPNRTPAPVKNSRRAHGSLASTHTVDVATDPARGLKKGRWWRRWCRKGETLGISQ